MKRLPRNLPGRPEGEGARLLGLCKLDAAAAAFRGLAPRASRAEIPAGPAQGAPDRAGSEALHDFRVALRRLRVILGAFGDCLGRDLPRKLVRGVRDAARATSAARDAEVLEARLAAWEALLQPDHGPGLEALRKALLRPPAQDGVEFALKRFARLEGKLRPVLLGGSCEEPRPARGPGRRAQPRLFGACAAEALADAAEVLRSRLAAVAGAQEDAAVHKARIAAKKLRYLLEPFRSGNAPCRKAVTGLRKLQDALGDVHDLNIAARAMRRCAKREAGAWARALVEEAAGSGSRPGRPSLNPGRNPVPGLMRLAALAGKERAERFGWFLEKWEGPKAEGFFRGVAAAAEILRKPARRTRPAVRVTAAAGPAAAAPAPQAAEPSA